MSGLRAGLVEHSTSGGRDQQFEPHYTRPFFLLSMKFTHHCNYAFAYGGGIYVYNVGTKIKVSKAAYTSTEYRLNNLYNISRKREFV